MLESKASRAEGFGAVTAPNPERSVGFRDLGLKGLGFKGFRVLGV